MQFYRPEWLNALWIVALLGVVFLWAWRKKYSLLKQFGKWDTVSSLTETHSHIREKIKHSLLLCVMVLIVLALAQPQWGDIKKEVKRKGVEIIFLIDTSLSMLAEDVKPSRIGKAKLIMRSFLRELKGDRIGIVSFAGSGFIQSPLTLDYDAFLLFANSIQVGYIPHSGTSLSEAINTAVKGYPESKQKHHVIILLSDGEHLEGDLDESIKKARESNVRIYTIGIGTIDGEPIPLRSEGGKVSGYKKDIHGQVVITKLNESLLREISDQTGGLYFSVNTGGKEVEWIYQHMQNIEKKEFKQRLITEREDHYQVFLALALILLIIEMLLGETKKEIKQYEFPA